MENHQFQKEYDEINSQFGSQTATRTSHVRQIALTLGSNLAQLKVQIPPDYPNSTDCVEAIAARQHNGQGDIQKDLVDFNSALKYTFRSGGTYVREAIEIFYQRRGLSAFQQPTQSSHSPTTEVIGGTLPLRPFQGNQPREISPKKRIISESAAQIQSPPKKSKEMAAQPPSEDEAAYYYYGLVGGRLLARTSTDPWAFRLIMEGEHVRPENKVYFALGRNKPEREMIALIRPLLQTIGTELESNKLAWVWFTAIRIGYEDDQPRAIPPVLLLNVEPGRVSFEIALDTALKVKNILLSKNVRIEVEVREHLLQNLAATRGIEDHIKWPTMKTNRNPDNRAIRDASATSLPLLSKSGWCVYYEPSKGYGTCGLFVTLSDKPNQPLGLTAAHVVSKRDDVPHRVANFEPKKYIHQGNKAILNRILEDLHSQSEELQEYDGKVEEQNYVKTLRQLIGSNQGLDKRFVGRVAWAQAFGLSETEAGVLNDWALLDLEKNKFSNASNQVFIDEESAECLFREAFTSTLMKSSVPALNETEIGEADSARERWLGDRGFIRIQSTIVPVGEKMGTVDGLPPTRVLKYGAASALTLGLTNGVEAVIRKTSGSKDVFAWNLLIVPFPNTEPVKRTMEGWPKPLAFKEFSTKGDSGAAVVSFKGEVLGTVVSGSRWMDRYQWRGVKPEGDDDEPRKPVSYQKGKHPERATQTTEKPKMQLFDDLSESQKMDITFVEPIDSTFRDIKHLTGQTVNIYTK
ncbi:hypothetical protein F5Y18DRAFT_430751 [Xylariaceae sp. FL1019]|nr:hypothetical protein F5Y18DRAFT_430751 [Xylariaceae sp. FL1019]